LGFETAEWSDNDSEYGLSLHTTNEEGKNL